MKQAIFLTGVLLLAGTASFAQVARPDSASDQLRRRFQSGTPEQKRQVCSQGQKADEPARPADNTLVELDKSRKRIAEGLKASDLAGSFAVTPLLREEAASVALASRPQARKPARTSADRGFADRYREPERPLSIQGGAGSQDSFQLSIYYRFPIAGNRDVGTFAVSPGLGWNFSGGQDKTLEREPVGAYHGYGHSSYDYNGQPGHYYLDRDGYVEREVSRRRAGRDLVELVRFDYETPRLGAVRFYGGTGLGYGTLDNRTRTVQTYEQHERTYDPKTGAYSAWRTNTLSSQTLSSGPGERASGGFATAFVGCRIDGRDLFGLPCDIVVECEKMFLPDAFGKDDPVSVTAGVGVGF